MYQVPTYLIKFEWVTYNLNHKWTHNIKSTYRNQGRNHGENLGSTSAMVGRICPPWLG